MSVEPRYSPKNVCSTWWPGWRWDQWLTILLLSWLILSLPSLATSYALLHLHGVRWQPPQPTLQQPLEVPVVRFSPLDLQGLTAKAVYVMDVNSGAVLYQKNPNDQVYPASVLKLLTALVVRQEYQLDDQVVQTAAATSSGTLVGIYPGEKLTVRSALAASLIASGNDAATMLAIHHPLGLSGFVAAMQRKADQLHLETTVVANPTGLDDVVQHTSARDLAILAKEVTKDVVLRQLVATPRTSITELTKSRTIWLQNTNELLGSNPEVVGLKTGTTEWAGENLILELHKGSHPVIIVIAASTDRYADARQVMDWLNKAVQWQSFAGLPDHQTSPEITTGRK